MTLESKVAIVTGAGRGIGRGVALRLAWEGADVAVVDIQGNLAAETAGEVEKLGRRSLALPADVSNSASVAEMVRSVHSKYGRIDILVNSAAIIVTAPMVDTKEEDWDRIMAINLKGTFLCCKAAVPVMMAQRSGKIVNFYSSGAKYGSPNSTAYAATKYGVWGFTLSLAVELAPYGINANCVSPGFCDTGMLRNVFTDKAALANRSLESVTAGVIDQIPLGRIARPEDIAAAVAFLCSSDADYITGDVLLVDGAINRLRVK